MPQSNLICPLLSRDLWSGVKFPIWLLAPSFDHNSCNLGLNEQCDGTLSIYTSRPFEWCPKGPIWCLFAFPTKGSNICNSHTNAIHKMTMHLGVIELHPLHFPSFVKFVFTHKHTFSFMGPCTSNLALNPMLRLWQYWQMNNRIFCTIVVEHIWG